MRVRSAVVLSVLIAIGWVVLQLLVVGTSRYYEWDEALYISQVAPGDVSDLWEPHRARGTVWLVAPVASWLTWVSGIRIYLMLMSAAVMVAGTWLWARLVGPVAALGALLFVVTWPAIMYGSFASPNLWVGLISLSTVAVLARGISQFGDRRALVLGGLIAVVCLFRPADGVMLASGVALSAILLPNVALLPAWGAAAWGWLLGLVPYWIEADRWGGLLGRFAESARLNKTDTRFMLSEHLRLADGANVGPDPTKDISVMVVVWWITLLSFAVVGVLSERDSRRRPATAAMTTGVFIALPYFFYIGVSAPRFLIPTYLLMSFAAAIGMASILGRMDLSRAGYLVMILPLLPFAVWHVGAADRLNAWFEVEASGAYEIAQLIRREGGPRCAFGSPYGAVIIHLASGCRGYTYRPTARGSGDYEIGPLLRRRAEGYHVFVLAPGSMRVEAPVDRWSRTTLSDLEYAKDWVLYEPTGRS